MRAHVKRRQRNKRLTIIASIAVIGISLAGVFYVVLVLGTSDLDRLIGQPISSADSTSLYQVSHAQFGPSGSSLLTPSILTNTGYSLFSIGGKPLVVYIGADYCPFCAIERWSIVIALSRFGNFTNLHYMTSSPAEGDIATFTFRGSTYASSYIAFRAFEVQDRSSSTVVTAPVNYTGGFNGYPFLNVGNKYLVSGAIVGDYGMLSGKNWTQILADTRSSDSVGLQLKAGANAITALVCSITGNAPASVCGKDPIPADVGHLLGTTIASSFAGISFPAPSTGARTRDGI